MIRLTDVSKYFNKKKSNEIRAIDHTSVELPDKGLVTFLGNSGCGKTTLLNAIGGLDKVDAGEIFIDNERLTNRSLSKKDEIRNAYIGYIFQNYNLIDDISVFENVALVLRMIGIKDKDEIEKRVMYILERIGIAKYKNRLAKMLSGGERQRVGIARALVKNPKIIIADEPTGNLDSKNTLEIMNIIKAISREKLVILVTHEREIAQFYSSRTIEIVDGKIASDNETEYEGDLDYKIDNKIFLKDLPVHTEVQKDDIKINYYSDRENEPLNVRIVVKNNNIYVETEGNLKAGLENVEMVDRHYEKISKDIYEDYTFDYGLMLDEDYKPRYNSIYDGRTLIIEGYRKVFSYSVIKKILLLGFVLASMFVIYAVSNVAGVTDIKDEKFVDANQNYLLVKTPKLDMATYQKYENMEGLNYVLPGNSTVNFTMPLDDYYQTAGAMTGMQGSLSDINMLKKEDLIAGSLPTNSQEIVIDNMVAKTMLDTKVPQQLGVSKTDNFVGRNVKVNLMPPFKIVGVVDMGSPSIYTDKSVFMDILINQTTPEQANGYVASDVPGPADGSESPIINYQLMTDDVNLKITSGRAPENDYEALVDETLKQEKKIGDTIDLKVNGQKLKIVGFYTDKKNRNSTYVSPDTAKYKYILSQKNVTLSPVDKSEKFQQLTAEGEKVTDMYANAREKYKSGMKEQMSATLILAFVILGISLIEMYLMLRSSFLSRIKEVGVLRAIGLKKKDVYKMFLGEIIALTTITSIPAMIVMGYIVKGIMKVPTFEEQYMMNPSIFVISFALVFVFNIIVGLLPVFATLRKTPAAILARNDVN